MTIGRALEATHHHRADAPPAPSPNDHPIPTARISKQTQPTPTTLQKTNFHATPPPQIDKQTHQSQRQATPSQMQPDATRCNRFAQRDFPPAQLNTGFVLSERSESKGPASGTIPPPMH